MIAQSLEDKKLQWYNDSNGNHAEEQNNQKDERPWRHAAASTASPSLLLFGLRLRCLILKLGIFSVDPGLPYRY
jgi:hypothetical protein